MAADFSFLRTQPSLGRDGFDLSGQVWEQQLQAVANANAWEADPADDGDDALVTMLSLHTMAHDNYRSVVNSIVAVAQDDDPALNEAGRLKAAARAIEPKLNALADMASREIERVDAEIASEREQIAKEARTADAIGIAVQSDIRRHMASMGPGAIEMAARAIAANDITTLQAIATAPAFMSGLVFTPDAHTTLSGGLARVDRAHPEYERVKNALAELLSPARLKRVTRLQEGKARAQAALAHLDSQANRLIDFNRARKLAERSSKRTSE